jgi:hypothetical protein
MWDISWQELKSFNNIVTSTTIVDCFIRIKCHFFDNEILHLRGEHREAERMQNLQVKKKVTFNPNEHAIFSPVNSTLQKYKIYKF